MRLQQVREIQLRIKLQRRLVRLLREMSRRVQIPPVGLAPLTESRPAFDLLYLVPVMHSLTLRSLALASLLCTSSAALHAQRLLTTFAGVVGGAGSTGNCTGATMPAELSFFELSLPFAKIEGVASCGYSGGFSTLNATVGPLLNSRSVTPVLVENPSNGTTFDGTASAVARYASLGAAAHANISNIVGNRDALFSSLAAATFTDFITASSPSAATGTSGFVRYQFSVDGLLSSLGAPASFFFGDTYARLAMSQNRARTLGVMNATVPRGGLAKINGVEPPAGWTTSMGLLSGQSTFYSFDLPMVWGTPWELKVGLLAWAYGRADTDFLTTAKITGVQMFDADHAPVTTFTLFSESGVNYADANGPPSTTVPEPSAFALMALGVVGLAAVGFHRRASRDQNG